MKEVAARERSQRHGARAGDISKYLLQVRCLLDIAGPSWSLSRIHCLGLNKLGLVGRAASQTSIDHGWGWGQGPSEGQPLLEGPEWVGGEAALRTWGAVFIQFWSPCGL